MKNKRLIIMVVVFVTVMVLAMVLYPMLSDKYSRDSDLKAPVSADEGGLADFTVYDMDMSEVNLSDYFGKPIVINFWATWCGPCRSELPAFDKAYRQYKDDVVFLMVNLTDENRDTVDGVNEFIASNSYSFPVYYDIDHDASNTYGIYSIPETIFVNADSTVHDTRIGALSYDELVNYIEAMKEDAQGE